MSDVAQLSSAKAPDPILRPALAAWMWERQLRPEDLQEAFGVSREWIRRFCLPFGDRDRRIPATDVMERIFDFTAGAVGPTDFYPERLRKTEPAP